MRFAHIFATLASIGAVASFPAASGNQRKWATKMEPLDPENKYWLSWDVDLDAEMVEFSVVVETRGFVGFGISPSGSMQGADIFIGGVDSISGFNYYFDMHGVGNQEPVRDDHNDWNLIEATENTTHTSVKFSRKLNTCDKQDYAITEDTTRIIWSYGETDDIKYHGAKRGSTSFNVIAPPIPPIDLSKYERWEIFTENVMPSMDTSYYCTVHKSPKFPTTHHIVAMGAVLENMEAKKHTHHFTLSICEVPAGQNASEIFEPLLYPAYGGHECYDNENPIPYYLCQKINYVWAVGGKMTVFPENLGLSTGVGETYYLLEIHYDNPTVEVGLQFKTGLEIYHTSELRETEVGIMVTAHASDPSLMVPPNTADFMIGTNCPAECTQAGIPAEGVTVFNVLLHSHLSGRKMKFRQFRGGEELPWILSDDSYDFNFQQNKPLREFAKILPGDELRVECMYDTRWKDGKVVLGGLTSRDEMCEAIFYYYPKVQLDFCMSKYPLDELMKNLGVTNYTIEYPEGSPFFKAIIHSPSELAGEFENVLSTKFSWTPELIAELKEKVRFGDHEFTCGDKTGIVKYPVFDKEYVPEDKCLAP